MSTDLHRTLGEELLAEGDRIGARRALLAALARAEDELEAARVQRALGVAATAIGDLPEARSRFACAHPVLARDADWHAAIERDLGVLEQASGELSAAVEHLRRAHELEDDAPHAARVRLAAALAEREEGAEALLLLHDALPHLEVGSVAHAQALVVRAVALDDEDAHAEALTALEAALGSEHPDLAPTLLALARLADARDDRAAGLALARRAASVLEGRVVRGHPALAAARERVAQTVAVSAAVSSRLPLRPSLP